MPSDSIGRRVAVIHQRAKIIPELATCRNVECGWHLTGDELEDPAAGHVLSAGHKVWIVGRTLVEMTPASSRPIITPDPAAAWWQSVKAEITLEFIAWVIRDEGERDPAWVLERITEAFPDAP